MNLLSRRTSPSDIATAAIIFDLDGVLMHSTPIHDQAYREVLGRFSIDDFDYSDIAGMRTREGLRKTFQDRKIAIAEDELAELSERKTSRAHELLLARNPVMPGCRETLATLANRFPLALASSASERTVDAFLDANHVRQFFRSVLSGGMVAEAKPSPEIYLRACASLEIAPSQCLVVEDAIAGIEAALRAGCSVCGITTLHSAEELRAAGASIVISKIEEILDL